jgi:hypothetical protein
MVSATKDLLSKKIVSIVCPTSSKLIFVPCPGCKLIVMGLSSGASRLIISGKTSSLDVLAMNPVGRPNAGERPLNNKAFAAKKVRPILAKFILLGHFDIKKTINVVSFISIIFTQIDEL